MKPKNLHDLAGDLVAAGFQPSVSPVTTIRGAFNDFQKRTDQMTDDEIRLHFECAVCIVRGNFGGSADSAAMTMAQLSATHGVDFFRPDDVRSSAKDKASASKSSGSKIVSDEIKVGGEQEDAKT